MTDRVRTGIPSGAELPVAHRLRRRSVRQAGQVILWLLPPRRAARRAQTALPAAACSDWTGGARRAPPARCGGHPKTGGSYHDPVFERPDLVEDDHYRFRHQAHGW